MYSTHKCSRSSVVTTQTDPNLFDIVANDINAFWSGAFTSSDLTYVPPGIVPTDYQVPTGCGVRDPYASGPIYCQIDQTIFFSPSWFTERELQFGDFAWIAVLAHEWGHHIQWLLAVPSGYGSTYELQADCLGGAYAHDAASRDLLDPGDVTEAVAVSAMSGDPIWLSQDLPGSHGINDDRISAFMQGYLDGFGDCNLPLSPSSATSQGTDITASRAAVSLVDWLPSVNDLFVGLDVVEEGSRSFDEIADGFLDPTEAREQLATWGWAENTYRNFAANADASLEPGFPTSIEVSLHRFQTESGASAALPYYANGRATALNSEYVAVPIIGEQTQAIVSQTPGGDEATVYIRLDTVVVRVSAVSPNGSPLPVAGAIAMTVETNASRTAPVSRPDDPLANGESYLSPQFGFRVGWTTPWILNGPSESVPGSYDQLILSSGDVSLDFYAAFTSWSLTEFMDQVVRDRQAIYSDVVVVQPYREDIDGSGCCQLIVAFTDASGVSIVEEVSEFVIVPGESILIASLRYPSDTSPALRSQLLGQTLSGDLGRGFRQWYLAGEQCAHPIRREPSE